MDPSDAFLPGYSVAATVTGLLVDRTDARAGRNSSHSARMCAQKSAENGDRISGAELPGYGRQVRADRVLGLPRH
jgi:hypothetical protein